MPVVDKPDIGDIRDNPPSAPPRPAPVRLPLPGQAEIIEQVHSGLGSPITLAYGRHVVGGHLVFQQDIGSSTTVMVFSLGEGEWDAIEWLEVNGARVDHTNTAIVHFHPGLDGEIGTETTPAVRNQKFCSLLPSTFTPAMHWPRTAYLVLKLKFDPESPTDGFQVRASYQCLRVRQFDNAGTQTAYSYSANPAWCALDAILRGYLKTRSSINEALTTAEKARFDWPAWKAWADACSATVGGEARWESHLPFVQQSDLRAALDWMLMVGRAYLIEKDGKLAPFHDEARASAATYDASDFLDGSLNLARRSVRDRANRHSLSYRDIDSGIAPGTLDSAATALTGTDTDFARRLQEDKMVRLLDGAQAGEVRSIVSVSDDTNAVLDAAFGANQAGTAYESPNDSYQQQTRQFDDEDHQDEIGRIITQRIDIGNSIPARAERLLAYIRARAGLSKLLSGRIGFGVPSALDHLPGDLVTLPAGQDFASTQVTELLEVTIDPDFSVTLAGIEYDDTIFIDSAGDQELPVPILPGGGKFTRVTANERTGSLRAYDNIRSDGRYADPQKHHDSGVREETTTSVTGNTFATSFTTVASYTRKLSPGAAQFTCNLNISVVGVVGEKAQAQIKIGALTSTALEVTEDGTNPTAIAARSVAGLTGGTTVTIELQARASSGTPQAFAGFLRVDPNYDDQSHWTV